MFSKKSIPILFVLLLGGGLYFTLSSKGYHKDPPTKYESILQITGQMLKSEHFSPKNFNDEFSKEVFKKFLLELDPDKSIFLKSDIEKLKKLETRIDNEILGEKLESFFEINNVFNIRIAEAEQMYKKIIQQPFDFKKDEDYVLDLEKIDFPKDENARYETWRRKLKYMTLERFVNLTDQREANKGKDSFVVKTDAAIEAEARALTAKVIDRVFLKYKNQYKEEQRFNSLVNCISENMDLHTSFFPPVEKRSFDESMSGSFFGIGASLQEQDGLIKIATIITGAPAWRSGELQIGDAILKVAQGTEAPIDIAGYAVEDAVKIIRGKKGTEVKLTVRKADGTEKIVSLIREKIILDETFARSLIINGAHKIGFIYLPEFYADFNEGTGRRCASDVAKEILKLKQENVDGIVLDLRNNGGGSLRDVVEMAGLFIKSGPIVQVKSKDERQQVLSDPDRSILYDGPFTVLVNEFSASASEIFAAAIQDYKRGVVIGSTSTYGKGTVQRMYSLGNGGNLGMDMASNDNSSSAGLGALKVTIQKFYRISGGSTQLNGVASDIITPDQLEYLKLREKDNPNALKYDEIEPAVYSTWKAEYDLEKIKAQAKNRIDTNNTFKGIKESTHWLSKQNDNIYHLNLEKFKAERKARTDMVNKLLKQIKSGAALNLQFIPGEENRFKDDLSRQERINAWVKSLQSDIYLNEAVKVLGDMINMQNVAKN